MKVAKVRYRGFSFEQMLKRLCHSGRFYEFLRTAKDTGYLCFDEVFLTRLTTNEQAEVDALARRTPQLHDFDPLPVMAAFPPKLGHAVAVADPTTIEELDEFHFYRLSSLSGLAVTVQGRHFLTAVKRHPRARAFFRAGGPLDRSPITFLESEKPVALIMPMRS